MASSTLKSKNVVLHDSGTISKHKGDIYEITIPEIANYKKITIIFILDNWTDSIDIYPQYYNLKPLYGFVTGTYSGGIFYSYYDIAMYDANYKLQAWSTWTGYSDNWSTLQRIVVLGSNDI